MSITQTSSYPTAAVGIVIVWPAASVPSGWLLCDGTSYLRTTYQALFDVIGTTYGSADGTRFNVPDLGGRLAIGKSGSTSLAQTNKGVTAAPSTDTSGGQSADHTHSGNTSAIQGSYHNHNYVSGSPNVGSNSGNVSAWHTHAFTTGGISANHTHTTTHTHTTPDFVTRYLIKY